MLQASLLALLAGLMIPLGAALASHERVARHANEQDLNGFIMDFGGGALFAAVALVLVPRGMVDNPIPMAAIAFASGGFVAWRLSLWFTKRGGAASQFLGALLDFVPESVALGASIAMGEETGILLAGFIALQNLPEGFGAYQEMESAGITGSRRRLLFGLAPLVGPVSAVIGHAFLKSTPEVMENMMLFCSGGIIFLIFEDIAPTAKVERVRFTAVGAVLGFLLGMIGTMIVERPTG